MWAKRLITLFILTLVVAACGREAPPHLRSLSSAVISQLALKGMRADTPIFIRVFKEESELEVWKPKNDGYYHLFKTYQICKWSGKLGPKLKTGDKQAPEGFYNVSNRQMNPSSKYHLSFNLGFPNAFDRAHRRTGSHLMIHGNCKSKGCYAMTDALVEEIYLLARDAFIGGQKSFPVHAFPFRMNTRNMERYRNHKWIGFWETLKEGYDQFELTRKPPSVSVCGKNYLINASFIHPRRRVHPRRPCPPYRKIQHAIYLGKPKVRNTSSTGILLEDASTLLEKFRTSVNDIQTLPDDEIQAD
ncbi:MAG: L,D-transpeptidase family protein [Methyloligellaceae bacterium]